MEQYSGPDLENWRPIVYRWCLRQAGNASDAEDLTQQVLITALRYRGGYRGDCSLRTWLFRITLQECHWWRRRVGSRAFLPFDALDEARIGASRGLGPIVEWVVIQQALSTLAPQFRDTFVLVKWEGFTDVEAAALLGIRPGTVRWRVAEAIRHIRTHLDIA